MMSFKAVESADGAAHYFESSDDYYGSEGENTQDALEGQGGGAGGVETANDSGLRVEPGEATAAARPPSTPVPGKLGHKGVWAGKGAAALGLHGKVDRDVFRKLLDGQLPNGEMVRKGKTLGSKDRKGIDFTFSAPKSVSIQALVHGDKRIVEAHDRAVRASIAELEKFAMARKKEGGKSLRENTQNLVVATFRHELSRAQDPQLHTHSLVMNMTQRSDGKWRAMSNEDMLRNVKLVGAFYRAHLANELRTMGYQLRETRKGGWELSHISDKAVDLFSSRSKEIDRLLKARGQDRDSATTMQKQIITLATRPRKTDVDRAILRQYWLDTAREAGADIGLPETSFRDDVMRRVEPIIDYAREKLTGVRPGDAAADAAVTFAIEHLGERQGIFSKAEVLEVAYGKAATKTDPAAVDRALERAKNDGRLVTELPLYQTARSLNRSAKDLIEDSKAGLFKGHDDYEKLTRSSWVALTMHGRDQTQEEAERTVSDAIRRGALVPAEERYTTQEAKQHETRVIAIERTGRGAVPPVATVEQADQLLASTSLNAGQGDAVRMILTSEDRFVGIQGLAGTGKSHMMSKAVDGIKAEAARAGAGAGYKVVGMAPYGSQNRALEELGMTSQTVASFLARKASHAALDDRTIVFLDEASVVPARQMAQLMRIVEERGARMVLIGDRKQTQAVEAGKPFEQLQDAGMRVAYLTEIQRQKNETLRAAVMHAADGKIGASVALLESRTVQIRSDEARHQAIATEYTALTAEQRASTLIVAGTNDARRSINGLVRRNLGLEGKGDSINVLESVDMTKAEMRDAGSYRVGSFIVPEIDYKAGMRKGRQYEILQRIGDRLLVGDVDGSRFEFNPANASMLGVYDRQQIQVAIGEPVTVTRNDKALGLRRGDVHELVDMSDHSVQLRRKDGQVVELPRSEDLHLRYSYVSTVHSAQGLTNDRVLIDANTRSLTANKAVYYVAISRERHELKLFTDDKTRLANAMSREPKKFAALELRDGHSENHFLKARMDRTARAQLARQIRKAPVTDSEVTSNALRSKTP